MSNTINYRLDEAAVQNAGLALPELIQHATKNPGESKIIQVRKDKNDKNGTTATVTMFVTKDSKIRLGIAVVETNCQSFGYRLNTTLLDFAVRGISSASENEAREKLDSIFRASKDIELSLPLLFSKPQTEMQTEGALSSQVG